MLDNYWQAAMIVIIRPFFANASIFSSFIFPPKSIQPSPLILGLFSEHLECYSAENKGPGINHCFPGAACHTKELVTAA